MPVSAQTPTISYAASGTATVFTYPFRILVSTDLKVYINGTVSSTGYTVTGVGDAGGGTVVFATAPSAGTLVRLQRSIPRDRNTDYVEGGALAANTLDDDFDRVVMMLQDVEAGTQVTTENYVSSILVSSYTATAGQTVFTLTDAFVLGANTVEVSVNGASQIVDVDYTETSSTSIAFLTGLNSGDVVVARVLQVRGLTVAALGSYANDAAAATGGVAVSGFYRNGSVLMIRVA
jgi:hypothetical protein